MFFLILALVVTVLAFLFVEWFKVEDTETRMRTDVTRAMHERLQLDSEMMQAMKAMICEAEYYSDSADHPYPSRFCRRR